MNVRVFRSQQLVSTHAWMLPLDQGVCHYLSLYQTREHSYSFMIRGSILTTRRLTPGKICPSKHVENTAGDRYTAHDRNNGIVTDRSIPSYRDCIILGYRATILRLVCALPSNSHAHRPKSPGKSAGESAGAGEPPASDFFFAGRITREPWVLWLTRRYPSGILRCLTCEEGRNRLIDGSRVPDLL